MKKILLFLVLLALIGTLVLWLRYGGGQAYPDLSTAPVLNSSSLEEVVTYVEPVGNVAVNRDGRIFFTVHPESRPTGNNLLEYVRGAAIPYPSGAAQAELFDTVLGVAIDLDTNEVLRNQALSPDIAPAGSFLQDLQVSADGNTIVLADASFWRKSPAIVVYDVETGQARRLLESHVSVSAENYVIRSRDREMKFLGGIAALRGGVDGIALGPEWLYFAAISGSGL